MSDTLPLFLPTIPGKVSGIVGWDPVILQCGVCGTTKTQDRRSIATFIILARFVFLSCRADGIRRCPDCMAGHIKAAECRRCAEAGR